MPDDNNKDYVEEMVEDIAKEISKDPDGKHLVEAAGQLKKQLLIKEYVDEATEGMSGKQRDDVARELKSHILDSADALAAEKKVPVDDLIVREVISKMGPADKIAAMYPSKKTFLEKSGLWKALQALGGIAVAFMLLAVILWLVAPDALQTPLWVVLNIVFALALAMVVITAIFFAIYTYESRLKVPYEARLKRLERSLNDATSPLKVWLTIVMTIAGMALITIFWPLVPLINGFGPDARLIPLFTPEFGSFIPYIILLGLFNIAIQLLYLYLRQKWIPSLLDAALSCGNALLAAWIFMAFPFNPGFSPVVVAGIKVLLVIAMLGSLVDAAKKLWQAARFFIYSNSGKIGAV